MNSRIGIHCKIIPADWPVYHWLQTTAMSTLTVNLQVKSCQEFIQVDLFLNLLFDFAFIRFPAKE